MNYGEKRFVLAEGLHSGVLRQKILKWVKQSTDNKIMDYFDDTNLRSFSTRSGDVLSCCYHDVKGKDAYIIQKMGDNPWQDLAALCESSQLLKSRKTDSVTAIVPVWKLGGQGRGGLKNPEEMGSHRLTAEMIAASGVDRLVTFTPTPEMFSSLYPVKVEIPDISQELLRRTHWNTENPALIIADEADAVSYAGLLGSKIGWPVIQCSSLVITSFMNPDFRGKDILIFTRKFDGSLYNSARELAVYGSHVSCYAPRIESNGDLDAMREFVWSIVESDPDSQPLSEWKKDAVFEFFITLDSDYAERVDVLPVDRLIADWLIKDRIGTI